MPTHKLLLLPGDGIGPEVMAEVKKLIAWMNAHGMGRFETEEDLVGGCCYDAHAVAITDATMAKAHASDAVIFGAVGGPKWDKVGYDARPEAGGLDWYLTTHILRRVGEKRRIVGADIHELLPIPGQTASDALAAKLAYKIMGYAFLLR